MKYLLVLWLALLSIPLLAQKEDEVIFNRVSVQGGFGGPIFELTNMDNQTGGLFGGGGGIILNDFFFGGFGEAGSFADYSVDNQAFPINMAYGGLWVGFVKPTRKILHFYSSLKIAGGGITLSEDRDHLDKSLYDETIFVVQPEAGLEANLFTWCRLALTANYRLVNGIQSRNLAGLRNRDFNAPGAALTLRFGRFSRQHSTR